MKPLKPTQSQPDRDRILKGARVEERIERGLRHEGRRMGTCAPTCLVHTGSDPLSHAAYRTALRTLCGLVVARGLRRAGRAGDPGCPGCSATLEMLRRAGLTDARIAA